MQIKSPKNFAYKKPNLIRRDEQIYPLDGYIYDYVFVQASELSALNLITISNIDTQVLKPLNCKLTVRLR